MQLRPQVYFKDFIILLNITVVLFILKSVTAILSRSRTFYILCYVVQT